MHGFQKITDIASNVYCGKAKNFEVVHTINWRNFILPWIKNCDTYVRDKMQIKQLYNKPLVLQINRTYFSRNITVNCMNSKTQFIHLQIDSENKCSKNTYRFQLKRGFHRFISRLPLKYQNYKSYIIIFWLHHIHWNYFLQNVYEQYSQYKSEKATS